MITLSICHKSPVNVQLTLSHIALPKKYFFCNTDIRQPIKRSTLSLLDLIKGKFLFFFFFFLEGCEIVDFLASTKHIGQNEIATKRVKKIREQFFLFNLATTTRVYQISTTFETDGIGFMGSKTLGEDGTERLRSQTFQKTCRIPVAKQSQQKLSIWAVWVGKIVLQESLKRPSIAFH